jgi:hypothetical protein
MLLNEHTTGSPPPPCVHPTGSVLCSCSVHLCVKQESNTITANTNALSTVVSDSRLCIHQCLPSQRLPVELTDRVIDYLHGSDDALKACALVARSWTGASQYHLFHTLRIAQPTHLQALGSIFFYTKGSTKRQLMRAVREIELVGPEVSIASLLNSHLRSSLLGPIYTLRISGADLKLPAFPPAQEGQLTHALHYQMTVADNSRRALSRMCERLRSVKITNGTLGRMADLAIFLSSNRLEDIHVERVHAIDAEERHGPGEQDASVRLVQHPILLPDGTDALRDMLVGILRKMCTMKGYENFEHHLRRAPLLSSSACGEKQWRTCYMVKDMELPHHERAADHCLLGLPFHTREEDIRSKDTLYIIYVMKLMLQLGIIAEVGPVSGSIQLYSSSPTLPWLPDLLCGLASTTLESILLVYTGPMCNADHAREPSMPETTDAWPLAELDGVLANTEAFPVLESLTVRSVYGEARGKGKMFTHPASVDRFPKTRQRGVDFTVRLSIIHHHDTQEC